MKNIQAPHKFETSRKEFLSAKELAERIPYSERTIRNMVSQGDFVRGVHYVKPKGRVIFLWSRVMEWIESEGALRLPARKQKGESRNGRHSA